MFFVCGGREAGDWHSRLSAIRRLWLYYTESDGGCQRGVKPPGGKSIVKWRAFCYNNDW
ncbi:MAG TPA: hypothetical protein PKU80_04125 [Candidatus Limiplasma sp.]|nr:hypothetical protein [Candidatus Limiplasma sp.]HRX08693.1 hypothetical protein [Candidatus Limiplasma sp.]